MTDIPLKEHEYTYVYDDVISAIEKTQIDGQPLPEDSKELKSVLGLFASIKIAAATSKIGTEGSLMAVKSVLKYQLGKLSIEDAPRWLAAMERNADKALDDLGLSAVTKRGK